MVINEKEFEKIANKIQSEWKMSGLADGLYLDFAMECCKRYMQHEKDTALPVSRKAKGLFKS